jgi:hypothetical protein
VVREVRESVMVLVLLQLQVQRLLARREIQLLHLYKSKF